MKKQHISSNKKLKTMSCPNPSIAEALCEIHFYSRIDYDNNLLDALKENLGNNYPGVIEQRIKQYRAALNESGVSVEEDPNNITRWIFKHKNRNNLIQIHPGVVSINQVGSYPGWNIFKNDINNAWKVVNKTLPIVTMKRIGLRYINLIPKELSEPLSIWLKSTPYFPKAILKNTTGFLSRSEISLAPNIKLIVNIGEHLETRGFLFDLDIISTLVDNESYKINETLEIMHQNVFDVFVQSLTDKYQSFLKRNL